MMERVLITGCHGLLGQKLVELYTTEGIKVHGVDLHPSDYFASPKGYTYHQIDLTKRSDVVEMVHDARPQVIINTAAMTAVDACEIERERCWKVNVHAVENLVSAARQVEARVIQVSTDYVFNGEAGPYSELDRVEPISYYGRSKHASENVVLGGNVHGAIARTAVLFGHGRKLKPSFVSWLVKSLREEKMVRIVTDQISNVTFVDDLAEALKIMAERKIEGIYHTAGRQIVSRYEFAMEIARTYELDHTLIQPTLTRMLGQTAPRPLQCGLIVDKAQKEFDMTFCNVEEALRAYREQEALLN